LWVCAKRLEKGRFAWPKPQPGTARLLMRPEELTLLLNGIDLTHVRTRRWLRHPAAA
jgi:transposase